MPSKKVKKKSSSKSKPPPNPIKFGKAAAKQTKRQASNVKRSVKAIAQTFIKFRDALGRFTSVKPKSSKPKKQSPKPAPKKPPSKKVPASPRVSSKQGSKLVSKPKASKQSVVSAKPKRPASAKPLILRPKQSYTLRELAGSKSKSLAKLLSNVEERADQIDALKSEDQLWTFKIYDRHSLVPYQSISGMMNFLSASGGLMSNQDAGLVSRISILTKGEPSQSAESIAREYRVEVEQRHAEQRKRNSDIERNARRIVGGKDVAGRRRSKNELLEQAILLADRERTAREATEKRLAAMESKIKRLMKPAKKKAANKRSTKK